MKKYKILLAIFLITFSTIVIEILYTRIFAVIYYSSFAFLMISLALFGYGLSGVFMALSKIAQRKNALARLKLFILGYAILLPVIYKITLVSNIDFLNLFNPISNLLLLILNFSVLLLPFFAAGVALVLIFTLYSHEIGKLYFIDLIGAALGGLAIIPLITSMGPSRVILLMSLVLLLLWLLMTRSVPWKKGAATVIILLVFAGLGRFSETFFPIIPKIKTKITNRAYYYQYKNGQISYSKWSPINKIDIGPPFRGRKTIWIDSGTMESALVRVKRDAGKMAPKEWVQEAIPYQLARKGSALIIGSAGGFEVLCAITNDFKNIVAVEMDPEICRIVSRTEADYIGNIFSRRGVHLLADEGRSVLKRLNRNFDVIQMVNSHNADALLSGGLSIAETYIYTIESFKDYWNHLNPDGFLSIVHWFGERMFSTAYQALRELGVDQPQKKFFVIEPQGGFKYFFMKKGDINKREIDILTRFAKGHEIAFSPELKKDNLYYKLASPQYKEVIRNSAVNIRPVHDNSPYFNQANRIGQFKFSNNLISGKDADSVLNYNLIYSNMVYLSILGISILFSFLFIFLPLKLKVKERTEGKTVAYFFFIGLAFIIIEIILIKVFQLYLGNPAYSISVIIFSLLISSGIGSLLSERINRRFGKNTIWYSSILVFLILIIYALFLFKIVYALIQFSLLLRFITSLLLISLLGLPMGIFFPTGLRYLGQTNKGMIGWAWGANAFATVLGSVLTVIIAINWNFSLALVFAAVAYLLAGGLYRLNQKKPA